MNFIKLYSQTWNHFYLKVWEIFSDTLSTTDAVYDRISV